jgi:predicted nucleotidyltransferase
VKASSNADDEAEETKRQHTGSVPPANERISKIVKRTSKNSNSTSESATRRSLDEIDRDEIISAIREVFSAVESLDPDTAITKTARVLGFRRTGARITEELRSALRTAIRRHIVNRDNGFISIECATIDDYTRDELVETLIAAIGNTWWEREEAIRAAARRLGFRRTGSRITKAFKSAINGAIRRRLLETDGGFIRRN